MVDREHGKVSLVRQCALLRISRGSVYYQPTSTRAYIWVFRCIVTITITLFEHDPVLVALTDYELKALERLNRAAKPELVGVRRQGDGRFELRAAQYVGVIRIGGRTIQVLPKILHRNPLACQEVFFPAS